jgi:hypothetical protein
MFQSNKRQRVAQPAVHASARDTRAGTLGSVAPVASCESFGRQFPNERPVLRSCCVVNALPLLDGIEWRSSREVLFRDR